MSNLKSRVSPVVTAASQLAQTAREMKLYATQLKSNRQDRLYTADGRAVAIKDLIRSLKAAKDALKVVASKAHSLDREVDFFSNHQNGLMQGNMRRIPTGDKVNWCSGQVATIQRRASRLAQSQGPVVNQALKTIQDSAAALNRQPPATQLPDLVSRLGM